MFKILVITPINHIKDLKKNLNSFAKIEYLENPNKKDIIKKLSDVDAIFTNPNKSRVFLDKEIINAGKNLKVICTASTGINHINNDYAIKQKIKILSLTKELKIINKISSTAELAITLTLMALRNIIPATNSVMKKKWDYENFVGRQLDSISIGVIGLGRLGKIYAKKMSFLGCKVYYFDPYINKKKKFNYYNCDKIIDIFKKCDVVSFHIHADKKNIGLVDSKILKSAKKDCIIINTSRGEILNEKDVCDFLRKNYQSKLYVDVLADEIKNKFNSPIYKFFLNKNNKQVCITPHIGGMTIEGQQIAYNHAAKMLKNFAKKLNK